MASKQRRYLAYLVRLWQVMSGGQLVWRASLEDPRTGEQRGFANLEQLIAFLYAVTGPAAPGAEDPNSSTE